MTPICVVDTETDGLHQGRRIWEVAMIRRDDEGERERSFFVGLDMRYSDLKGLEIGRFFDRHPSGRKVSGKDPLPGLPPLCKHDAAREIMQFTFGAQLVGAVPSFDAEGLAGLLRSEGYLPAWKHRLRCVETLTSGFLRREVGGLRDCAEALGLDFPQDVQHTALGDARMALQIWDAVMTDGAQ
ncbi:MAG: hypothetical protein HOV78_11385 [Hamadaea sp.]|nr:hypothetical protein [Hamadaea sp.]